LREVIKKKDIFSGKNCSTEAAHLLLETSWSNQTDHKRETKSIDMHTPTQN